MNYHNITSDDMKNGEGIRVVLWLSGCEHHCPKCQNPETWSLNSGIKFDRLACNELFRELNKDYITGITLSGGDPFHTLNRNAVEELLKMVKYTTNKNVWVYTGYTFEELTNIRGMRILLHSYVDVLVDGKYKESLRDTSLKWRGSSNQRVIDVPKSFGQNKVVLYCD